MFGLLFAQQRALNVFCLPKAASPEGSPHRTRWASLMLSEAFEDGNVQGLNLLIKANPDLVPVIGVFLKRDFERAVLARVPCGRRSRPPVARHRLHLRRSPRLQDGRGEDLGGGEEFLSALRQVCLVALIAPQSSGSLRSELRGESRRILPQAFRTDLLDAPRRGALRAGCRKSA